MVKVKIRFGRLNILSVDLIGRFFFFSDCHLFNMSGETLFWTLVAIDLLRVLLLVHSSWY